MNAIAVTDCGAVEEKSVVESGRRIIAERIGSAVAKLRMEFVEGLLVVHGEAGSFYHKQLIQESLKDLPGVEDIANHVRVRPIRAASNSSL